MSSALCMYFENAAERAALRRRLPLGLARQSDGGLAGLFWNEKDCCFSCCPWKLDRRRAASQLGQPETWFNML